MSDDLVKRLRRACIHGTCEPEPRSLVETALLGEAAARIERLEFGVELRDESLSKLEAMHRANPARLHADELAEALHWIAKRDNPANPAEAMLDPKYISEDEVRRVAHDIIACARAALAKIEKEEGK